jgi:hypothetical protein
MKLTEINTQSSVKYKICCRAWWPALNSRQYNRPIDNQCLRKQATVKQPLLGNSFVDTLFLLPRENTLQYKRHFPCSPFLGYKKVYCNRCSAYTETSTPPSSKWRYHFETSTCLGSRRLGETEARNDFQAKASSNLTEKSSLLNQL